MTRHLYVHVPFCAHLCGYCDFVVSSEQRQIHGRYVDALLGELELRTEPGARYDTISIGGGTPTLLETSALERLLGELRGRLAGGGELSIEANPETIDAARARLIVDGGVNRVSLGVQTLQPQLLETLERLATPGKIVESASLLRDAGCANLNFDMIWAIPGQVESDLVRDLRALLELAPEHVSAYELEYHATTRFAKRWGAPEQAVGDAADGMYDLVVDTVSDAGYEWYETSNFARPGRRSRHHLGYWAGDDYLGVGVGAVGTLGMQRRTNLANVVRYIAAVDRDEDVPSRVETLTPLLRQRERLMLGLRLDQPCAVTAADRAELIDSEWLTRLVDGGMIVDHGDALQSSRRGRMVLNSVLVNLLR